MAVSLTQFERGAPFDGDAASALAGLRQRLTRLNLGQILHDKRLIVVIEGWHGSGKRAVLRQLVAALDPCHTAVHCAEGGEFAGNDRHWLAPFWARLPRSGQTVLFHRSWYSRPVDNRARGVVGEDGWTRTCDEINEFEAQQTDHETLVAKLFFHVSADVQARRLRERAEDTLLSAIGPGHEPPVNRAALAAAWEEMFAQTDTRWAPWRVIDANDEAAAQIAALGAVADLLEKSVPAEPQRSALFRYA